MYSKLINSSPTSSFLPPPSPSSSNTSMVHAIDPNELPLHSLVTIPYDIYDYSSIASTYFPHHILQDLPHDQGSRWTTTESDQSQFLTIKLQKKAVVTKLVFGKFQKPHVCNLREFRVFAGLSPDTMIEIFHGGLENTPGHETLAVKYQSETGTAFPVEYIKIVPHASFEKEFPYSIWYLEVKGILDEKIVEVVFKAFLKSRESQFIAHCLKFLRQRHYTNTFDALTLESSVHLEDPLLSQLYKVLVKQGDFEAAEKLIEKLVQHEQHQPIFAFNHLTKTSILNPSSSYACNGFGSTSTHFGGWMPTWHEILATDAYGNTPMKRGGHQLCLDYDKGHVYLFGGWDGLKNLNDFWFFDIPSQTWQCLAINTELEMNGPSPRSCHKMCLDPSERKIYMLGEFLDHEARPHGILSDFWCYDLDAAKWVKLSTNTANDQGPSVIYDHQLCMDSEHQCLYVFGGRVVTPDTTVHLYSGLFEYSIPKKQWRTLRADSVYQDLAPRVGHFMLFYPPTRQLLIFGGQKNKEIYHHFLSFDLTTETITKLPIPEFNDPDWTQRAIYDPTLQAVLVLSNVLSKPHASSHTPYIHVYLMHQRTWYKCGISTTVQPCARYAHQLTYDPSKKCIYFFGGNPDIKEYRHLRLNDFWVLSLQRPEQATLLRQCLFLIRRQKFLKLCQTNSEEALKYLQHQVSEVADHHIPGNNKAFAKLSFYLFQLDPQVSDSFDTRNALFDQLASFFPSALQQPHGNLLDLLPFV